MKLIIDETNEGQRLDIFLSELMPDISRSKIQTEVKKENILINSKPSKPSYSLKIGDIILGEKAVYINDFKTVQKSIGEGSNSLDWIPNKKRCYETYSTKSYLEIAKNVKFDSKAKVGIIGSGDMHSREYDRIMYLNKLFGEDCEDMESAAALRVCEIFGVDKLALRVISNNDLLLTEFNKTICKVMQKFVIELINDIIEKFSR